MEKQFSVEACKRSGTVVRILITAPTAAEARRLVRHQYDADVRKVEEITFNAPQPSPWSE